ncbi:MAG: HAD family phosphatase [Gammaproteobacteria bacterium]|nr:HAD family phosphatase [Gammaproteobacteria bacterium]
MGPCRHRVYPDALIFDMDGLLLGTERLYRDSFEEACHDAGWPSPDMTVYANSIGATLSEGATILRDGYGPSFPWEAVRGMWRKRLLEHAGNRPADVKSGAMELLSYCRERGIPCGLATSTHSRLAARKLALARLDGYFSVRVTGDAVHRGKPDPEPYSTAAERLGIRPERCWAMEDSANGARSALAAGCRVFQVPDLIEPSEQLRGLGHEVVDTLYDVLEALREAISSP